MPRQSLPNVGSFCVIRQPYPKARWKVPGVKEFAPNWIVEVSVPGLPPRRMSSCYEICEECLAQETVKGFECKKRCRRPALKYAEGKLAEAVATWEETRLARLDGSGRSSHKLTGADGRKLMLTRIENRPGTKESTKAYWRQIEKAIVKTWPEFNKLLLRDVTAEACEAWAARFAEEYSPTRYNNAVSFLTGVFDLAIKKGARRVNPMEDVERVTPRTKDLAELLPTPELFHKWVNAMREAGHRRADACADFVEFVSYCGCRKGETKFITLSHCQGDVIRIVGDPRDRTKNGELRTVPMIPAMKDLLKRIRQRRPGLKPTDLVLELHEAQGAMDAAAKKVGMGRLTHHDLRHYFGTVAIESGVDIPTVAKWLGHKDGGALLMRTYTHVRNAHSIAKAAHVAMAAAAS